LVLRRLLLLPVVRQQQLRLAALPLKLLLPLVKLLPLPLVPLLLLLLLPWAAQQQQQLQVRQDTCCLGTC
jgi:hypothetical protein